MTANAAKKIGRRAAGSWGRPGCRAQKRAAAKALRRLPVEKE